MVTITVDDITYRFIGHAIARMRKQNITLMMVEEVMLSPDRNEVSKSSGNMLYVKRKWNWKQPLQVVVDEDEREIISVHWLKPLR